MRIAQEAFTVLPDPERHEVNIVMGGFRLTLSAEETRQLAAGLDQAIAQVGGGEGRAAVPELSALVGGAQGGDEVPVSVMITQAQRTALREKGYSDEAIRNMKPTEAHRLLGIGKAAY